MNGRQAAKAAAKRIAELEYMVNMQCQDIKDYNACITGFIKGESVCKWCEEAPECQREVKEKEGCTEWWLRYRKEGEDASEGVHAECEDS